MTSMFSFDEKKKFAKILFEAMIGKLITDKFEPLSPLTITSCNGATSWSFSDASVDYKSPHPTDSYQFEVWFKQFYIDLGEKMKGSEEIIKEETKTLECLMDVVIYDQHLKCLQRLLTEETTEEKVTVLLAHHYFKPLVYGCSYIIDSETRHCSKCDLCEEDVTYGDTSFGSKKVWYGQGDIVLQRSVINVCLEKDLAEKDRPDDDEEEVNVACGDPSEGNIYQPYDKEKTETNMKKKSKCLAISQGITNAFCEARKDKALFKQFIPSFLVTEKYITIILYNCELDKLLMSGKYPIWEETGKILDISTVLKVWFTLNYCHKLDETSEYKCLSDYTPSSGFRHLVGKAYASYMKDVQRPLKQEEEIVDMYLDSPKFDVAQKQMRARAVLDITNVFYNL